MIRAATASNFLPTRPESRTYATGRGDAAPWTRRSMLRLPVQLHRRRVADRAQQCADTERTCRRLLAMANRRNCSVNSALAISKWTSALEGLLDGVAMARLSSDGIQGAPPRAAKDTMLRPGSTLPPWRCDIANISILKYSTRNCMHTPTRVRRWRCWQRSSWKPLRLPPRPRSARSPTLALSAPSGRPALQGCERPSPQANARRW